MSNISGKDTEPELKVRSFLHKHGFRYRTHYDIAGEPDIAFPKPKIAIFIHGCFWHMHDCKHSNIPKSNTDFWERNVERDKENVRKLEEEGWTVKVVWECEINSNFEETMKGLVGFLERIYSESN